MVYRYLDIAFFATVLIKVHCSGYRLTMYRNRRHSNVEFL